MEYLRTKGIMTGVHYPRLITDQRALVGLGTFQIATELTWAKQFAENEVSLPIHAFLSDEEIDHVIASCNEWSPD